MLEPFGPVFTCRPLVSTLGPTATDRTDQWARFGFPSDILWEEDFHPEYLGAIQGGIPQGSAVSPLCAEMVLRKVIEDMPNLGKFVNYADDFLIMCKDANDLAAMVSALRTGLKNHPSGPLTSGLDMSHGTPKPFTFLGYEISRKNAGKLKFELGNVSLQKVDRRLTWLEKILTDPKTV